MPRCLPDFPYAALPLTTEPFPDDILEPFVIGIAIAVGFLAVIVC